MNTQEVFDKVTKHLLIQNRQSVKNDVCRYQDDFGNRCSIGCLFPEDAYSSWIENFTVENYFGNLDPNLEDYQASVEAQKIFNRKNCYIDENVSIEFLYDLRNIHDGRSPSSWKIALQDLAVEHNLIWKF